MLFESDLGGAVVGFEALRFFEFLGDEGLLLIAGFLIASGLALPILETALDAEDFLLHLLEGSALIGGVAFGLTALFTE